MAGGQSIKLYLTDILKDVSLNKTFITSILPWCNGSIIFKGFDKMRLVGEITFIGDLC